MDESIFWLMLFVIFTVIEIFAPGIILIFFAFGALITSLISMMIDFPFPVDIAIFVISSLISLGTLRKKVKDAIGKRTPNELPADEFIGKKVKVLSNISSNKTGRVELNGTDWNAESEDEFKEGDDAIIISRDNLTFKIAKIN